MFDTTTLAAPRTAMAIAQAERVTELETIQRARPLTNAESRELERLLHRIYCRGRYQARSREAQLERARAKLAAQAA